MKIFENLIKIMEKTNKKKNNRLEYGCAMLFFDFPGMKSLQDKIKPEEIYETEEGYGLEHEPHVTLLFGLHADEIKDDDDVLDVCLQKKYEKVTLNGLSLFKNELFEVLKFDVVGDDLYYVNNILKDMPHTTDYPNYHPHTTIAYILKGKGDEVVKRLGKHKPYKIIPKSIVYSKPNGTKKTVKL
jgi:2'-5' RNA ligase